MSDLVTCTTKEIEVDVAKTEGGEETSELANCTSLVGTLATGYSGSML